jgi:putative sigma-54 modulation protein
MRIDVIGRDVKITDDLRQHAERKGEKLPKYFDRTQLITFTIFKKDSVNYTAECLVDVEGHDDFVANADDPNIKAAIDGAVQKATRQIKDFKEKLKAAR